MKTPIAILFFNRPEVLTRLIPRLAEVQPEKLYLVCDGARQGQSGEHEKVLACQQLFDELPWTCEIQRNFSPVNLGCRQRIVSGLDWVFAQEEEAIILEDDCIPIVDFFPFVEEMLERYRNNPAVFSVGGTNLRPQLSSEYYDIVFTKYAMIWGWATWRRAWQCMDKELQLLDQARKTHHLKKWLGSWRAEWYWVYLLKHVSSSWGYRWAFTGFMHQALHLLPAQCLVENVGFTGDNATHTASHYYELPNCVSRFPSFYRRPPDVESNQRLDQWIEDNYFSRSLYQRIKWSLRKICNSL